MTVSSKTVKTPIFIASDHAGVELKSFLVETVKQPPLAYSYEIIDLGPDTSEPVDYSDFADQVCLKIYDFAKEEFENKTHNFNPYPGSFGILICGSGQGMAIRANRFPYIRAALGWNSESVRWSREHNHANVLCVGSRLVPSPKEALAWTELFLKTPFEGGRHTRRVLKLSSISHPLIEKRF